MQDDAQRMQNDLQSGLQAADGWQDDWQSWLQTDEAWQWQSGEDDVSK